MCICSYLFNTYTGFAFILDQRSKLFRSGSVEYISDNTTHCYTLYEK